MSQNLWDQILTQKTKLKTAFLELKKQHDMQLQTPRIHENPFPISTPSRCHSLIVQSEKQQTVDVHFKRHEC